MMTRAPARAVAATPPSTPSSSVRNAGPTPPCHPGELHRLHPMPCMDAGMAWTSVSVPKASHGSGRIACRHRAIPDLPELDPPFSTIT